MPVNAAKKRPGGSSDMMNMFVVQDRKPGFSPRIKTSRSGNKSSTSYETRMIHRGAMAFVGQKSLHLKQATHKWACKGSAL